jgi:transposase
MKAYSMDLRERVIAASEEGVMTHEEIAETFQVSVSWIGKLRKLFRETGSIEPKPHRGGQPGAFQGEAVERLSQAVKDNPDATLKQLATVVGISCSTSATDRMLRNLGITRKKRQYMLPSKTGLTSNPNEMPGTMI